MTSNRKLRLSLLAGAFVLFVLSGWWYYEATKPTTPLRTNVLTLPFMFEQGRVSSGEFTVDVATDYDIAIAFHRTLPDREIDTLLGISPSYSINGKRDSVLLPVGISIWCDGELLLNIDSVALGKHLDDSGCVVRTVALFAPESGKHYGVLVLARQTNPLLSATKPELRVIIHPPESNGGVFGGVQLLLIIMLRAVFGLVFIVLLVINGIAEIRSRGTR